jgi:hypothetical protein
VVLERRQPRDLERLKFAFMGGEARKDRRGLLTDWVYADIGESRSATRDFGLERANLANLGAASGSIRRPTS